MEIRVLKFGGSSLSNGTQFKKVGQIVNENNSRRYVIASAPGKCNSNDEKVTDLLNTCYKLARENVSIEGTFKLIQTKYNKIIKELDLDISLEKEFDNIKNSIIHHASLDYISSRGEYLNAIILAKYLDYDFIDAENNIFFLENGSLDSEKTNTILFKTLKKHPKAVIPGFYGSMPDGSIRTFSRGGSDVTGSIVARAVDADVYENWTDVSGMLMADPRIVENPKVINLITYRELRELSYMGASVLHEDAIFPVKQSGIPINIRNTNSPQDSGTMIVPSIDFDHSHEIITGIAGKKGFSIITIEKDMMNTEVGFGLKVLQVLAKHKIPFEHLPTGIDTMSIIVNTNTLIDIKDHIKIEISKAVNTNCIKIEDGLAMIAIVGRNMKRIKGIALRAFTAIEKSSIDIRTIDLGSSDLNIIIGVKEEDYSLALKSIYSELVNQI